MPVETTEQYAARLSSYVEGRDHLSVLKRTPSALLSLFKSTTGTKLKRRPGTDRWSVAEILAHLTDAELVFGYRLRLVVGSPGTAIQAYDQNVWQKNAGHLLRNPMETLEYFTALRRMNLAFVRGLDKNQRESYGIHSERGRESVLRMLELYAGHDENHLRQIKGIVRGKNMSK